MFDFDPQNKGYVIIKPELFTLFTFLRDGIENNPAI